MSLIDWNCKNVKYLNDFESEMETSDNLIPPAKAIKAAIEKYSGEHGRRDKD